jgi:hypothetical protein
LGRQPQVRESLPKGSITAGFQRCLLSNAASLGSSGLPSSEGAGCSQCPNNGTSPQPGEKVWAARRGGRRGSAGEIPSGSRPWRWKAPWSPGSRRPSRGDGGAETSAGPSRSQRVSSPAGGRAGDSGVSPGRRGGERRQRARTKAYAPEPVGTARTAPRGRVLHSVQGPAHRHVASFATLSRVERPRGASGAAPRDRARKSHGRSERDSRGTRNGPGSTMGKPGGIPEEPSSGVGRPDAARLAVWRFRFLEGKLARDGRGVTLGGTAASEPGRRLRPPSTYARTRRAPSRVLVRRGSCRSRQASSGLE